MFTLIKVGPKISFLEQRNTFTMSETGSTPVPVGAKKGAVKKPGKNYKI